jgi:hypothetical protein
MRGLDATVNVDPIDGDRALRLLDPHAPRADLNVQPVLDDVSWKPGVGLAASGQRFAMSFEPPSSKGTRWSTS